MANDPEKKVEKLTEEVREQQIETQTDNVLTNVPSQGGHDEAVGERLASRGKKEPRLVVDRVGEDTIVSCPDGPVKFVGAEGRATFARLTRASL